MKFLGLILTALCLIFLKSEQKLTEKDALNQTMMNPRKWETQALRYMSDICSYDKVIC